MSLDIETAYTIQGYAYVVVTGICVILLYGYVYHLYHSEKKVPEIMRNMRISLWMMSWTQSQSKTPLHGKRKKIKENQHEDKFIK